MLSWRMCITKGGCREELVIIVLWYARPARASLWRITWVSFNNTSYDIDTLFYDNSLLYNQRKGTISSEIPVHLKKAS